MYSLGEKDLIQIEKSDITKRKRFYTDIFLIATDGLNLAYISDFIADILTFINDEG